MPIAPNPRFVRTMRFSAKTYRLFSFLMLNVCLATNANAQASTQPPPKALRTISKYKEFGLLVGYAYTIDKPSSSRYHVLELGLARASVDRSHHYLSGSVHFSNEFILKGDQLVWGPKVGFTGGLGIFFLGADLIYYTDLSTGSLRLAPFFGLGSYPIMIGLRPHVLLAGNDDLLVNKVPVAVVIRILPIARRSSPPF